MQPRPFAIVVVVVLFGCSSILALVYSSSDGGARSKTLLGKKRSSFVLVEQGDSNRKRNNHTAAATFVTTAAPQQYGWTEVDGVSLPWYEATALPTRSTNTNTNTNTSTNTSTSTNSIGVVNNTVPETMTLINSGKLLYCANANAATTYIQRMLKIDLCSAEDCPQSVHVLFDREEEREAIMDRAISFTHVRNPWDRIWSAYEAQIASGLLQVLQEHNTTVSFANFVHHVEEHPTQNLHWMPVSNRCLTSPDAQGRVFHYDYILKVEDDGLSVGLDHVLKSANVSASFRRAKNVYEEPVTVQSRTENYRQAAALAGTLALEDLVDSVGRTYQDDIRTFGYSFEKYN